MKYFETDDEIFIRHYNNYRWFCDNGEALIQDIKMLYKNHNPDSSYTFRQYYWLKDETKIIDEEYIWYYIMDNLNQIDLKMIHQSYYTYDSYCIGTSDRNVVSELSKSPLSYYEMRKQMKRNLYNHLKNKRKFIEYN